MPAHERQSRLEISHEQWPTEPLTRCASVVQDPGALRRDRLESQTLGPPAPVRLLAIEEEPFVEPSNHLISPPRHRKAGSRDPIDRPLSTRRFGGDVGGSEPEVN